MSKELSDLQLEEYFSTRIIINNTFSNVSYRMYQYMYHTANLACKGKISQETKNEILGLIINDESYVQYGIFGKVFISK